MTEPPRAASSVPQGAVCRAHVDEPAVAACRRCGTFVCDTCRRTRPGGDVLCPECAPVAARTPWEERKAIGFGRAFGATVKGTLFEPSRFFRTEPADLGYGSPISWAVLCAYIGGFFSLLYATFLGVSVPVAPTPSAIEPSTLFGLIDDTTTFFVFQVVVFLATPIAVVIVVFLQAAVFHGALALLGAKTRSFDTTVRVVAYASSADLFQIVPVIGPPIAFVWGVVVMASGLAAAHDVPVGRAWAAVVVPLVLVLGCLLGTGALVAGLLR